MELNKSPEECRVESLVALEAGIDRIAARSQELYGTEFKGLDNVAAIKEQAIVLYETEFVTDPLLLLNSRK